MAASHAGDQARTKVLYQSVTKLLFWLMLPVLSGVFLFGSEALLIWLGEEFQHEATAVVQWLALGWLVNSLARPAFTVLQAVGRPDLVAKAHLAELLPYLGLLWFMAETYGLPGVAATWAIRVFVDVLIMNILALSIVPMLRSEVVRSGVVLIAVISVFSVLMSLDSMIERLIFWAVLTGVSSVVLWPIVKAWLRKK